MHTLTINTTWQRKGKQFIGVLEVSENEVLFYSHTIKPCCPTKEEALQEAINLKETWIALEPHYYL